MLEAKKKISITVRPLQALKRWCHQYTRQWCLSINILLLAFSCLWEESPWLSSSFTAHVHICTCRSWGVWAATRGTQMYTLRFMPNTGAKLGVTTLNSSDLVNCVGHPHKITAGWHEISRYYSLNSNWKERDERTCQCQLICPYSISNTPLSNIYTVIDAGTALPHLFKYQFWVCYNAALQNFDGRMTHPTQQAVLVVS